MQTTANSDRSARRHPPPAAWLAALGASLLLHVLASTHLLALALAVSIGHQRWMHAIYPVLSALGGAGALVSAAGGLRSLRHGQQRRSLKHAVLHS